MLLCSYFCKQKIKEEDQAILGGCRIRETCLEDTPSSKRLVYSFDIGEGISTKGMSETIGE